MPHSQEYTTRMLPHSQQYQSNVTEILNSRIALEHRYEAMRTNERAAKCAKGRTLRFLANVDPVDVSRALNGLDPESTLVVVVSKSFTTAETMLNARTLRSWLLKHYNGRTKIKESEVVSKHVIALSANVRF